MAKFKVQLFGGQTIVQSYEFDEAHLNDGTMRFLRFDGYFQSPVYIYSYLDKELSTGKMSE